MGDSPVEYLWEITSQGDVLEQRETTDGGRESQPPGAKLEIGLAAVVPIPRGEGVGTWEEVPHPWRNICVETFVAVNLEVFPWCAASR